MVGAGFSREAAALAVLWSQVRVLRTCVLIAANGVTPSTWSRSRPLGALGLSLHVAVIASAWEGHGPEVFVVATLAALASLYQGLPYDVDNGGVFEVLVLINLCAGFAFGDLGASLAGVRAIFAAVYAFAALAKLNRGYMSLDCSCATAFGCIFMDILLPSRLISCLGERGVRLAMRANQVAVVMVEFAIPALVLSPLVRLGAYLDLVFHLAVGIFAFDFSLVGVACLPAFLAPGRGADSITYLTTAPARALSLLAALATLVSLERAPQQGVKFGIAHGCFFLLAALIAAAVFQAPDPCIQASLVEPVAQLASDPSLVSWVSACSFLLALLNGSAPYLGLKTHNTWTMFSNLQVEGGQTNHFFIPAWQPFSFLKDAVVVLDSDLLAVRCFHNVSTLKCKSSLQAVAQAGRLSTDIHGNSPIGTHGGDGSVLPYCITYTQLRALVSGALPEQPDFFVEYLHPGLGTVGSPASREAAGASGACGGGSGKAVAAAQAMLGEQRKRLVVSNGVVVEGDGRLAKAAPLARRLGFARSWLPDRRPVCCH